MAIVNKPTLKTDAETAKKLPKQSLKPIVALLVAVVVLGVASLVGLVIFFSTMYVESADYEQFATETDTVIADYNDAITANVAYLTTLEDRNATDQVVSDKAKDWEKAYSEYVESAKQLDDEKALRDGDVKAAYDKFVERQKAFTSGNERMRETLPVVRAISVDCSEEVVGSMDISDLAKLVESYDKTTAPCVTAMKQLASSKNANAASVGKKSLAFFDDLRARATSMQAAYKTGDRTKFQSEYNAFIKKTDSFATDTDISSINNYQDTIAPDDALNTLHDAVVKRISD